MIRKPAVSGRFYPSNKSELLSVIKESFQSPLGPQKAKITGNGRLAGLIVPHAGYIFSGPVASWAYSRLKSEKQLPKNIVILGPKHTSLGERFSISSFTEWNTPLGNVKVNQDLVQTFLNNCPELGHDFEAHLCEHSIEVQLPFLQQLYADKEFSIIPIAIGFASFHEIQNIARGLKKVIKMLADDVLILISSDFSHNSTREDAYRLDSEAIEYITSLDSEGFYRLVVSENRSICGVMPISTALEIFDKEQVSATKLTYATSMDVMEHEKGVGYASIIFEA